MLIFIKVDELIKYYEKIYKFKEIISYNIDYDKQPINFENNDQVLAYKYLHQTNNDH